jgi:pimeloyl-ACP methyl ester carboxylesterase
MQHIEIHGRPVALIAEGQDEPVMLLHSTGSSSQQWRVLVERLRADHHVVAPDLTGYGASAPWTGRHAFTLADEAAVVSALLERLDGPVRLVGHSYGGAVVLHFARTRPEALSSLTLIEPVAFHLLRDGDATDRLALREIQAVAGGVAQALASGDLQAGFGRFVDYWSGPGAWSAIPAPRRASMAASLSKVALDFHATIHDPACLADHAHIDVPTLLLQGSQTALPTRRICERLACGLRTVRRHTVTGAGHMLPITHRDEVNELIVAHLNAIRTAGHPAGLRLAA